MSLQHVPIYAWTDSTIVLQWIKEHPSRWKTYVANRVVEIQESLQYDKWQHISTKYNPADLASRGIRSSQLINNELWWQGPAWLSKEQTNWPTGNKMQDYTDLEAKELVSKSYLSNIKDNILLKYSSYTRLTRIIATLQRFVHNCKHLQDKQTRFLTSENLKLAEHTILKLVQQTAFPDDYNNLLHNETLSNKSRLLKLSPFMDREGLIRLGGRLDNAMMSYSRRHPIILPRDHHVTSILIDKLHLDTLHGGTSLVLNVSRDKFWILDARRAITSRIHKCMICFRHRAAVSTQLMGSLPSSRVNVAKPFTKVGIDYAGPIAIKLSSQRNARLQKAYICVFICMTTRAIHLELVSSLTSEAFIASLKRFVARRGLCSDIYSDCGTNFVGGKSILDKDLQLAIKQSTDEAAQYFASRQIHWHFNPPAAPHFGGLWEAGVKSVKHHLRRTLQNTTCTFEELSTTLTQIEACLNSRPICYIHNDATEQFVLTPGHFLIGQALNNIPEPEESNQNSTPAQRWKHVQQLMNNFWKRWCKDYLNQMQQRPKWCTRQPNIQVGDVVILKNENMPPTTWPLGKVEEVFPGNDGLVRVVQVRTKTTTLKRPISKICQLPLDK